MWRSSRLPFAKIAGGVSNAKFKFRVYPQLECTKQLGYINDTVKSQTRKAAGLQKVHQATHPSSRNLQGHSVQLIFV